jgi:hypothetical protein
VSIIIICTVLGAVLGAATNLYITYIRDKDSHKKTSSDIRLETLVFMIPGAIGGALMGILHYHPLKVQTTWVKVNLFPLVEIYGLALIFSIIFITIDTSTFNWGSGRSKSFFLGEWLFNENSDGNYSLSVLATSGIFLIVATIINGIWTKNSFFPGVLFPIVLVTLPSIFVPGLLISFTRRVHYYCWAQGGWTNWEVPRWYKGIRAVPGWLIKSLGVSIIAFIASGSFVVMTHVTVFDADYERAIAFNKSVFTISILSTIIIFIIALCVALFHYVKYLKSRKKGRN